MLFNSYIFILIFLPSVVAGYFLLNHFRLITLAKSWLFISSIFFYGYWNTSYIPLLLGSIFFNFIVANEIIDFGKRKKNLVSKKALMLFGVSANVAFLFYFKYMDFFISNINYFGADIELLHLALPHAISFFTLQQIAYIVDVYEGLSSERKFLDYALFVSFFPQLIAGPIVHHRKMMPQFMKVRTKIFNPKNFSLGIFIFTIGLFKKSVIADTFAIWANEGFNDLADPDFFQAWGTSLSYTFQLYFDFSGYSDMAIGIALLFNIMLPKNFNSPFKSVSIVEFWTRWHITLSEFITTYIFTPILRSFKKITFSKQMFAIFVAMFLAGVWHGAGWTFVVYGLMHASAIVFNHIRKKKKKKLPHFLAWFFTFNFLNISFSIFRAKDLEEALKIFKGMFGFNGLAFSDIGLDFLEGMERFGITIGAYMSTDNYLQISLLVFAFYVVLKRENSMEMMAKFKPSQKIALLVGTLFVLSLFSMSRVSEFIYFNF